MCVIPLKPTDDPLKEEQVQKLKGHMLDEYAVRYLESIGATPTAANIKVSSSCQALALRCAGLTSHVARTESARGDPA